MAWLNDRPESVGMGEVELGVSGRLVIASGRVDTCDERFEDPRIGKAGFSVLSGYSHPARRESDEEGQLVLRATQRILPGWASPGSRASTTSGGTLTPGFARDRIPTT